MLFIGLGLAGILTSGCSKFSQKSLSSTCAGDNCGDGENLMSLKSMQSSLLNQNQILKSFSKCLGVAPSQNAMTTYNRLRPSLSIEGKITDISAPSSLSALVIAGEVCRDLITKESALDSGARMFFKTGGALNIGYSSLKDASTIFKNSAQALSVACLGRELSQLELSEVATGLDAAQFQAAGTVQQAALFTCSAVVGSLSGQQF